MALVVKDRVKETTTTTGTGTLTLAGAMSGFQAFSVIGNTNTTYYAIYEPSGTAWEVGIGTYTLVGTTLSRDTILASSNAGSAVNFGAGTKVVFCTYPAGKSVYYDASGNVPITGALNVTSASATSFAVGLNGTTNPAFTVDSSTASQAAGFKITGAATGGTVALVATDSGSNTSLTINAKGTGTIGIGSVSTGVVTITPNTSITGALGIGTTTLTAYNLRITKTITGAVSGFGITNESVIQSDVTTQVFGYRTTLGTQAASFTLPNLYHIAAEQGTFGATSTVTSQYGFIAGSNLTGATNNYGFYSNIASGTGRWNFYAGNTAANYFGGTVTIQTASATALTVGLNGSTNPAFTIDASTASQAAGFKITGAATGGTVALVATDSGSNTSLTFNAKGTGTISIGSVSTGDMIFGGTASATRRVEINTNGQAIFAYGDNSLTTNVTLQNLSTASTTNHGSTILWRTCDNSTTTAINSGRIAVIKEQLWTTTASTQDSAMTFSTTLDGSMAERVRINSNGSVGLGGTSASIALLNFRSYSFAGAGTGAIAAYIDATVPNTLTGNFQGFRTNISTTASAFTCAAGYHFYASQGTIGATSAITSQYGFICDNTLTGATNNYGFFSDIASGTGRWNFYAGGTAQNYLASGVNIGSTADANWIDDASHGAASTTLYIGNQSITTSSDVRLKTNIQDTQVDALEVVGNLRVVDFNWEDPSDISWNNKNARGKWTGLIAQEAIEHIPYAVNAPRNRQTMEPMSDAIDECGKDIYWFIEYQQIVPVLIKAIQQQQQQIDLLTSRINTQGAI